MSPLGSHLVTSHFIFCLSGIFTTYLFIYLLLIVIIIGLHSLIIVVSIIFLSYIDPFYSIVDFIPLKGIPLLVLLPLKYLNFIYYQVLKPHF
jgi:hypothetical protein